jgi:hypothetical protein
MDVKQQAKITVLADPREHIPTSNWGIWQITYWLQGHGK